MEKYASLDNSNLIYKSGNSWVGFIFHIRTKHKLIIQELSFFVEEKKTKPEIFFYENWNRQINTKEQWKTPIYTLECDEEASDSLFHWRAHFNDFIFASNVVISILIIHPDILFINPKVIVDNYMKENHHISFEGFGQPMDQFKPYGTCNYYFIGNIVTKIYFNIENVIHIKKSYDITFKFC